LNSIKCNGTGGSVTVRPNRLCTFVAKLGESCVVEIKSDTNREWQF